MSSPLGLPYQATMPPAGASCHGSDCRSVAVVRLIVPRPQISGHDDDDSPLAVWDMCELDWPRFRDACTRSGHPVVDITGDLRALQDEFPRWNIWSSDTGRLYAARYLTGPHGPQATTVHACLVAQLRARMHAAEATELHHV